MQKSKNTVRVAFLLAAAILAIAALILTSGSSKAENVSYISFLEMVEAGTVSEVNISDGDKLTFTMRDSKTIYKTDNPRSDDLKLGLLLKGVAVKESGASDGFLQPVLIVLLMSAGFVVFRSVNKHSGKSASAIKISDVSEEMSQKIGFSNVAGNEEAKNAMEEIVDFIKNPEKYEKLGARMPRGIIFYGAPGTGKTLMAKAVAGEAGVPFYAVSGSDFVQMYVGVGAARVRELFEKAAKKGKAVIFIDEIDALGKKRSAQQNGGNDERDQTLNALLTEMSGFKQSGGIIVIAATNRLDTLDEALLRPGRFDRQIEIALPDLEGRKSIIELYMKGKPFDDSINIESIAKQTVYFSGAMLENLLNEAAICAAGENVEQITLMHIDKAYYTIIAGSEKKNRSGIVNEEKRITAFHEAGHALVTKLSAPENSVAKVTIIPSAKGAAGFSVNLPKDKIFYTKKDLEAQMMIALSGRVAEEIIFGENLVTTGASNDIERVTKLASDYVSKYGMCDTFGLISAAQFGKESQLDECRSLISKLFIETKALIESNISRLESLAEALLERETLCEAEVDEIMQSVA